MKYKLFSTLLFAAMAAALAPAAAATTWYVNGVTGSDNDNCLSPATACKTIGRAMYTAASGDTIILASATYTENLNIGKSLTIIGSGASTTIIDGGRVGSVVAIVNGGLHVTLSMLTIQNGLADAGGGILNPGSSKLTISNSIITQNVASGQYGGENSLGLGGGIYNGGPLTVSYSIITRNVASGIAAGNGPGLGGGIYNGGPLTVSHSTLSGNTATGQQKGGPYGNGGAIWNLGTATIRYSTLSGNDAAGYLGAGGAIYNGGTLTVSDSTLSGDRATWGGGISNGGSLTVSNSTLSGDTAWWGGGISNGDAFSNGGPLTVSNSTLSGNSGLASGAGIRGGATISNATISGNFGVGIIGGTIQNSIVENNSKGNCSGSITSNGYNLSSDGSCSFTHIGDLNNTDPLLGKLQNNGGPTQTQALLPGSPAIDSGNPHGCTDGQGHLLTTDQRGAPRPDKEDTAGCDRGAFERQTD